jgi:transposase
LTARKLVQGKLYDIEMSLRGILRGFGLKAGRTAKAGFASRIIELTEHHPALSAIAKALLAVHEVLLRELNSFEKQVRKQAKDNSRVRLLMTAPGVGVIVGLAYVAAVDDPGRFSSSKTVGAHFGMTPKKYQSGEIDVTGRISKIGDKGVRAALYEAAHTILTKPVRGGALKSWAAKLAKRVGMKKAKVALARKLAVILHRMLANGLSMRQRQPHERPGSIYDGAVLAAVNTALRRLWRWPAASVDRHCARRL